MATRRRRLEGHLVVAALNAVAEGRSLRSACRELGVNVRTVLDRIQNDSELAAQYERARESGACVLAGDVLDIARGTLEGELDPAAARVAIDALKWAAGRMSPKRWGDRPTQMAVIAGAPAGGIAVAAFVDAPPQETYEEWVTRQEVSGRAALAAPPFDGDASR